jgi:TonB family protein
LTAIALASISLLALVIWLGWKGPAEVDGKAHAAMPDSVGRASVNAAALNSSTEAHPASQFPAPSSVDARSSLSTDPVWKPDPGGQPLYPTGGKPSAGAPIKFAAKVDALAKKKSSVGTSATQAMINPSTSVADSDRAAGKVAPNKVAPNVVIVHGVPASQTESQGAPQGDSRSDSTDSQFTDSQVNESAPSVPSASGLETNRSALNGVLTAKASMPDLTAPVSLGVSGGKLVHRVSPNYPAEARVLRQGGTVILAAMVMEDGRVGAVRVIEGPPVLAQAAVVAVKQWRYKPFELDGKPVKNEIGITLHFKLPSDASQ